MMAYIAASQYNTEHQAFEIYFSGCNRKCPQCHNPELHNFGLGKRWRRWFRINAHKLHSNTQVIKRIWIMGGDALYTEPRIFYENMHELKSTTPQKERWLWTGANFEEIPSDFHVNEFFTHIKTGVYQHDNDHIVTYHNLPNDCADVTLASANQKLYLYNPIKQIFEEWQDKSYARKTTS